MSNALRQIVGLFLLFLSVSTGAQRLGLIPPGTPLRKLSHDSIQIVFPAGFESTANRIASLVLEMDRSSSSTMPGRFRRVPILLQPQTNVSNGYVGLLPFKSEFYLQPSENAFRLGSLPWEELLAIHEYRHVQQTHGANTGITRLAGSIFGDIGFAALYVWSVPDWFVEGDAVMAETRLSPQGRGRLSYFTHPYRELAVSGKEPWPFLLAWGGSYRYNIPDRYTLGYLIVNYGREAYGEHIWDTILHHAARLRNPLVPFGGAMQKRFGKPLKDFYQDAYKWHADQWVQENETYITYPKIGVAEKEWDNPYLDMSWPRVDSLGRLYASITTFDRTNAIYRIQPNGQKVKIVSTGLRQDSHFDQRGSTLVWTELRYHPRWERVDRNVIVFYDLNTGRRKQVEPEKGYAMPNLNSAGDQIAALHTDQNGRYQLHIIDTYSGAVLHALPNPENLYLGHPRFSDDEKKLVAAARNASGQMALVIQDISSGEITPVTPYSYAALGRPAVFDKWILIDAGFGPTDQIYAIDTTDNSIYQVSQGGFAHYQPEWDAKNNQVICVEYRINGRKPTILSGIPSDWTPVESLRPVGDHSRFVGAKNLLEGDPSSDTFAIKSISHWHGLIAPHSLTFGESDGFVRLGLLSDNLLNNTSIFAGYEYDPDSKDHGPFIEGRFGMFYPEVIFGLRHHALRRQSPLPGSDLRYLTNDLYAGLALPLLYTPGVSTRNILLSSVFHHESVYRHSENFASNQYLRHQLMAVMQRLKAYRQYQTPLGIRADVSYAHNLSKIPVSQWYGSMELAVRGVHPTHYVNIRGEWLHQQSDDAIIAGNPYIGARGYALPIRAENMTGISLSYGLPVLYPDMGIIGLIYCRRWRLNLFCDMDFIRHQGIPETAQKSIGAEWIVDFDFVPISLGLRYSHRLDETKGKPGLVEFVIPLQRF